METFVLVQNPGDEEAVVSLALMTDAGLQEPAALQKVKVGPRSRISFDIGEHVTAYYVSTMVTSDVPMVAERAMYGGGRTWAHGSIGYTKK